MTSDVLRSGRYNPCNGCSDHCTKPEYLAYKAEQETIRKNKAAYYGMNDYVFRQSERNRRARK